MLIKARNSPRRRRARLCASLRHRDSRALELLAASTTALERRFVRSETVSRGWISDEWRREDTSDMLAEREPDWDDMLESIRLGGASAAAPAGDMTSLAAWLGPRMFMVAPGQERLWASRSPRALPGAGC